MAMTREDMLRELELLPAWKLRDPGTAKIQEVATSLPMPETVSEAKLDSDGNLNKNETVLMPNSEMAVKAEYQKLQPVQSGETTEPVKTIASEIEEKNVLVELTSDLERTNHVERASTIQQMDWQQLQDCVKDCQACDLAVTRGKTVFGVGDANADWLIVGEAPGTEEDQIGEPFVGHAGKLLDNMLAAIQLKRGDNVYLANVLKCRPPDDRDPHDVEVTECSPFLKRQIELIKPKLILALGEFAAQSLLQSDNTIAGMRGQLLKYNDIPVIVTYHPAYLLRNLADKSKAWEDLCFAKRTMQNLAVQTL